MGERAGKREGGKHLPFTEENDGVRLAVRLTPRADRNRVDGVVQGQDGRAALHLRLAAPPVEGAANRALVRFVADALDLPNSAVTIRSGEKARLKILHLSGSGPAIMERLAEWVENTRGARM